MPLTQEQEVVAEAIAKNQAVAVNAVAGSGKTTTLVAGANRIPAVSRSVLAVCFNKGIQLALEAKMPKHVSCKTLNAIGHRTLGNYHRKRMNVESNKLGALLKEELNRNRSDDDLWQPLMDMLKKAKQVGIWSKGMPGRPLKVDDYETWERMCSDHQIDFSEELLERARRVLKQDNTLSLQGTIDFDDQLYVPVSLNVPFEKYDQVLVDEAQDLNEMQHVMIERSLSERAVHAGEGLQIVGDPHQSIYGFRGSVTGSMEIFTKKFRLQPLPMTICFRCPSTVLEVAQKWVPHIRPREGAPLGEVYRHKKWDLTLLRSGDTVLCRLSAPLFELALELIANGRAATMAGKDIGAGLAKLIQKITGKGKLQMDCEQFLPRLRQWQDVETAKAESQNDESLVTRISDQATVLRKIISRADVKNMAEVVDWINQLFADKVGGVWLSTIHRAKGLEWPRVFALDDHLMPMKWAVKAAERGNGEPMQQERNLMYVQTTRAEKELHYINSADRVEKVEDEMQGGLAL